MGKKVKFARINRRFEMQQSIDERPFDSDMLTLASSRLLRYTEFDGIGLDREWIAADLEVDATGTFLMGIIGFATRESRFSFDSDAHSWRKGQHLDGAAARERTLIPFAVDLRPDRRWVAFVATARIRPSVFVRAFSRSLNTALESLQLLPSEWEVDLVSPPAAVRDWLREHPNVVVAERTVRLPNPVRNLSGVRAEIAEIHARTKREIFNAARHESLNLHAGENLENLTDGIERGDADLKLKARNNDGSAAYYKSWQSVEDAEIPDYGESLDIGMELVRQELAAFSARRAGEPPEQFELL